MNTSSLFQLFEAVQLAVYNLLENKELQNRMNGYGLTQKRVQEGNTLLKNARQLQSTQYQHTHHTRRLSLQIKQDSEVVLEALKDHVAIAKSAYRKEPHVIQELNIKRVPYAKWAWVQHAIDFYSLAPEYMETLQQYGATPESFEQNKAAAEALLALKAQRLKKKGDAENSTQQKNQAIKALRAWYGEFRKLARIAFQDTPQVLETFGIVVPSSKKKRKEAVQE